MERAGLDCWDWLCIPTATITGCCSHAGRKPVAASPAAAPVASLLLASSSKPKGLPVPQHSICSASKRAAGQLLHRLLAASIPPSVRSLTSTAFVWCSESSKASIASCDRLHYLLRSAMWTSILVSIIALCTLDSVCLH